MTQKAGVEKSKVKHKVQKVEEKEHVSDQEFEDVDSDQRKLSIFYNMVDLVEEMMRKDKKLARIDAEAEESESSSEEEITFQQIRNKSKSTF